jgi:hypothetical protein
MICRTLNEDVMHMFYGSNTFVFNLNFRASGALQHAGGACFYNFSGLAQSMMVSSRVASYIKHCEATFSGASIGILVAKDPVDTEQRLRKWLSDFIAAFKDEHRPQMTIKMEQMFNDTWSPVFSGTLERYTGTKNQHVESLVNGVRRRFRAILSRSRKVS